MRGRLQWYYIAFIGIAILPPLFYVRQPLLHDEMTYLAIGHEIALGGTLYVGIADHKPPGIYYLAAWLWQTVPEPYLGGRILVYLAHATTGVLLFKLGARFRGRIGAVASLLFLLGVYSPAFDGYILMTEPFGALLLTGATLLLFEAHAWSDIVAGLLLGIAVLFNQTVLLFGVVVLFWSAARVYATTDETDLRAVVMRYGLIGTGFVIPLGLTALYAVNRGMLSDMVFYTIVLPANYYDTPYFPQGQLLSAASYLPVWLLAIGTSLYIGRRWLSRGEFDHRLVFLCLWFGILAIPGLTSFHGSHRYMFIMPAAALLAAIGLNWSAERLSLQTLRWSARQWLALGVVLVASLAVFIGAAGFASQYLLLVALGLASGLVGTAAVTYVSVSSLRRQSALTKPQWAALVAGVFVVLIVVGGTAGVNGRYLVLLTDESIETQAEDAAELAPHVDGRFYALGPPTRYELTYFEGSRPARTFITAPYGKPLADRVTRTLEHDEVEYVLVKREQVTDGRIAADYTYYAETRQQVISYVEAHYEPTTTTDDFVIYTRETS